MREGVWEPGDLVYKLTSGNGVAVVKQSGLLTVDVKQKRAGTALLERRVFVVKRAKLQNGKERGSEGIRWALARGDSSGRSKSN